MNPEINFTGIEWMIDWMEQTGLLDAISDVLVDVSVEALIALITIAITVISSLAIGVFVLAVLAVVAVVLIVTAIVVYVLRGIGLTKIAKKLGVKYRFLAWIPYAHAYLLGACAEQSMKRNGKKTWKWGWILLFSTIGLGIGLPVVQATLYLLLSSSPMLSALVTVLLECSSLILLAVTAHCLWSVCKEFMDNVPAIILAILAPLWELVAVLLFITGFLKVRPAAIYEVEPVVLVAEEPVQNE